MKTIKILNSKVNSINFLEVNSEIKNAIIIKERIIVGHLNIHAANIAHENKWYSDFVNSCNIVFCDGKGVQLAALLQGHKPPPQVTYHTYFWQLLDFCHQNMFSLFLLGSSQQTIDLAKAKIKSIYPDDKIFLHHGYFEKSGIENEEIIKEINSKMCDILIVGFGMPIQEKWIIDNKDKLNVRVILYAGAFLEWISGAKKQAPSIITKIGMEWFYRLLLEPKRLFRRYILGNPLFFYRLLKTAVLNFKKKC
jgi:N-acetylglucosaminyldiphosphoundecaprenol N-acetyl-beta-D-mannosaminyltransferase